MPQLHGNKKYSNDYNMKNWDIFYDFLNKLKQPNNVSLIESVEKGIATLFESATVAQTLKNKAANNPFYDVQIRFVKQIIRHTMETHEHRYPETGDRRIPYEYILKNKIIDTFVNWVAWIVITDVEDVESSEDVIEKIKEAYNNLPDKNQTDIFGYNDEERKKHFINITKKLSNDFLQEHYSDYEEAVNRILYEKPQDNIGNPRENGRHNGTMAGWGDEEFEAIYDYQYRYDPFYEEALEAWIHYIWEANTNPIIAKRFKDPTYTEGMACRDADNLNEKNFRKIINKINVEIGREKYEEAEIVIEMDNDFVWVNSGKPSCSAEGRMMGHCGNEYGPDKESGDELWSLRQGETPSKWNSHITAVINGKIIPGKRVIKQIKGNGPKSGNTKPDSKYHPYILKLLTSKENDKWIVDGFYTEHYYSPKSNFELSDLSENYKKLLYNVRPELFQNVEELENA